MENIVRKGEIACNNVFYPIWYLLSILNALLKCRLQFVLIWTSLKFCRLVMGYSFPKRQSLDFKLKEVTDHIFKFDENNRKCYKPVENTVGKGEIARYKQFLLFPQCFQKTCTADT